MNRVLILGGGFGGLATAHALRRLLTDEDEIMVVDRGARFTVGFRKTWTLIGEGPLSEWQGDLNKLEQYGIQFVKGTVTAIDRKGKSAEIDGRRYEADFLVVALGAQLAPQAVPGLTDHAHNIYENQSLDEASATLNQFDGGRVAVGVFGLPYKCPAAPYEIALLVNELFKDRGIKAAVEVFTPQPMSLPVLGDAGCGVIEGRLGVKGIAFLPMHKATAVEEGQIHFANGRTRPFDLLLAIPPHRCPQVVVEGGLAEEGGWVKVNPETMETPFPQVYAVGDLVGIPMANGKRLPMAGVFAEAQGEVVASQIAAMVQGQVSDHTFKGHGGCYLEAGDGEAMLVEGNFLARPPEVQLSGPNAAYLEQKRAFEQDHLAKWF